jgi:two-component system, sensor histidine kinase and response regulator
MAQKKKDSKSTDIVEKNIKDQGNELNIPDDLYRPILDSVTSRMLRVEPVIITDAVGKIIFWNQASEQMFGFSKDEKLGTNIQELFKEQQLSQIYPVQMSSNDRPKEVENELSGIVYEVNAKGRFIIDIPLEISPSFIHLKGETFVVLIARNITERILQIEELQNAKDEAEKANRLKSEFLSNMSHEIRTPMNAILGFAGIALDHVENEEHKGWLRIILESGKNLLHILNDILDLSKIEAERMVLQQQEFSIRRLMNDVREVFSLQASQKRIKFEIEISDDTPEMYIGDEHRLRQILINFLSNAFKFTLEGGVVKVHFHHLRDRGYFEISDTGIGIPQDKIHTIFNAFEQVDGTYTRQYSGTGLGLAITRRLVELMEGKIEVISEEKKGSTFKFQLKLQISSGSEAGTEIDQSADSKFQHILKSTERYRKGVAMVKKWIQFAEGDKEIEDIICEAISLLPEKLDELSIAVNNRDTQQTDFLTHSLKGETLNLHLNDVGKLARKMNELIRNTPHDWKAIQECLSDLRELVSLIPPDFLEKHIAHDVKEQISGRDTILIAEDNIMNQKLMKTIIEKLDFACDIAPNGLIALNMLMDKEYLMLLLDMQMPIMDGLELLKIIRDDFQLRNLYVVAVTAHAMKGDKERFLNAGCNDYLPKPIDFDKLSQVIENTLKHNQSDNEDTGQ